MMWWLKDVKDSDKVGLLLLYTGVFVTFLATVGYMAVIFHGGLTEALIDQALSSIKDFFAVGLSLVTAAMGVLRFQSKSNGTTPPEAPK